MTSSDDLDDFFSVLNQKLKIHRQTKRQLDRFLSTDFNIFTFIKPDEKRLSNVIANLLNPASSHGQQRVFLNTFLRRIGKDNLCDAQPPQVATEYPIENPKGSIDVLVDFRAFVIAIENKPRADDGDAQLSNYLAYLKNTYKDRFCLIYLTQKDRLRPTSKSIEEDECSRFIQNRKLLLLSYNPDILEWLRECSQLCESDKFRGFLRDFMNYIPTMEGSMSNSSERKMIVEHALENKENLEIALDVGSVYDDLRKQLIKGFATGLKECLKNHLGIEWVCIEDGLVRDPLGPSTDNSLGFAKKSWNREYGIGIQPETRENKCYKVGVYTGRENDSDFPIKYLHKRMLERTGKEGSKDIEWIWRHALNNDDLLIKMYTGEAVTEFAGLIKEIIEVAAQIIDEHVKNPGKKRS